MGLISFIKNAGAKIFKSEERREEEKATLITDHIKKFGFDVSKVNVAVDDEKVILKGSVDTQANKNKIIVTAGNVEGISAVEDHLLVTVPEPVAPPEPEKQFYTVKKVITFRRSPSRFTVTQRNTRSSLKPTNRCSRILISSIPGRSLSFLPSYRENLHIEYDVTTGLRPVVTVYTCNNRTFLLLYLHREKIRIISPVISLFLITLMLAGSFGFTLIHHTCFHCGTDETIATLTGDPVGDNCCHGQQ
jgi:hypothetical protein